MRRCGAQPGCGDRRWWAVRDGRRALGWWQRPRPGSGCRMESPPVWHVPRPRLGWALVGGRPNGGDSVGDRSPAAIAHAGVLDQGDLDELSYVRRQVGWQRRRRLLDVL